MKKIILLLISILLIGCASTINTEDNKLTNGIIFIDGGEGGVYQPFLNRNYIVYVDNEIILYNINSGEKKQITYDMSGQIYPKIIDNQIYWVDSRNNRNLGSQNTPTEVWVYDIDNETEEKTDLNIDEYLKEHLGSCDKNGKCPRRLCYEESCVEIRKFSWTDPNITDKEEMGSLGNIESEGIFVNGNLITKLKGIEEKDIFIWKNKILWADNRNGVKNFDIFMYDIDTKTETQITNTQEASELDPAVYENLVVFSKCYKEEVSLSGVKSKCEVVLLNINTDKEQIIFNMAGNNIQIEENKIVWEGWRRPSNSYRDSIIFLYII